MVICVSRAFCSTDKEKRETARSLATARRTAKNNMFTNNNFARESRYFVHFLAIVARLEHETS